MSELLKLPIGIDSFEKIRKENFFYVDKTKLIEQLIELTNRSSMVFIFQVISPYARNTWGNSLLFFFL